MKNKTISEYDVLRVLITALVIIGHATYISIETKWGGCDYSSTFLATDTCTVLKLVQMMTRIIYKFHMPLFMALSGALFYYTLKKPMLTFISLAESKAKRLLIPFITVSLFYSVPLKLLTGYFKESQNLIADVFIGQICIQGNTHLWFLSTLFWIFLFIYIIEKFTNGRYRAVIWTILLLLSEVSSIVSILQIQYVLEYSVWFYTGVCFEKHRTKINDKLTIKTGIITFILFLFGFIVQKTLETESLLCMKLLTRGISLLEILFGMFSTYIISYLISQSGVYKNRWFQRVKGNSFGLYLYSDPWNYVLLAVGYSVVGNKIFISNLYAVGFYFCRILFTAMMAWLIIEILRKLKIKYLW